MPNPFLPQTLNRYSYAYDNPLVIVDANGHFGFLAALVIGALVGGATSAIMGGDIGLGMLTGAITGGIFLELGK